MDFCTTIVIVTAIIAVCYLANLYVRVKGWRQEHSELIKYTEISKDYLYSMDSNLDSIDHCLKYAVEAKLKSSKKEE